MTKESVHVLFKYSRNPYGGVEIDTTSGIGQWSDLSPFVLGPIDLPNIHAENMENLWQFSKVYSPEHVDADANPTPAWFEWRRKGFASRQAYRYPMGKGRKPLYAFWYGQKLGYIEARKVIYATVYAQFVRPTESYRRLEILYQSGENIVLRDYDAYDHIQAGLSLSQVLNDHSRKCGHAFILAMMLEGEMPA